MIASPASDLPRRPPLLDRRRTLEPEPGSAGAARRFVRDALVEAGRDDWVDASELAVSEIVTNASLHAHTPIELRVQVHEEQVCVEVRDFNPTLPVRRDYEDEATTGRGMGLVAIVARACGVRSLGDEGKVVWFSVGVDGDGDRGAADGTSWYVDEAPEPEELVGPREVDIVLRGMPPALWLSARQHHDAILRELVLHGAAHGGTGADVAAADAARSTISCALVNVLGASGPGEAVGSLLPAANRTPELPAQVDLRLSVPADSGPSFAAMQDALDLAEHLAVEGALFTRPALPEIVAVRDWACEQVIAQLSGVPASPWPGAGQPQFETEVRDRARPAELTWDDGVVLGATTPVIAADDANRIIAVSAPAADVLGWSSDELVGRRVVTVVPPHLREAHVAGFSRHLSTGEAHVLGAPLDLPVLRRDGTEVRCHLRVERVAGTAGRSVYLGWFDPVDAR